MGGPEKQGETKRYFKGQLISEWIFDLGHMTKLFFWCDSNLHQRYFEVHSNLSETS